MNVRHARLAAGTGPAVSFAVISRKAVRTIAVVTVLFGSDAISTIFGGNTARANGVSENFSWQFMSSGDRVNRAFLEDLRRKNESGYYQPARITNNIERQYNCSVSSSATGNVGSNSTSNAGPTTNGAAASGKANESFVSSSKGASGVNSANVSSQNPGIGEAAYWDGTRWATSGYFSNGVNTAADIMQNQSNQGDVTTAATGDVRSVSGNSTNYQALNSTQSNPGDQVANANGSTACTFGTAE
ncbi:hypothetical protein [Sandarakinorhabdus sp.]|uniref:hypothetical protein n=1 Tax=Sandarakinorhabdus sp. TaxID=1916663 RepID=UPI003F715427